MSSSRARALLVGLLAAALALVVSPVAPASAAGTASISGRVIAGGEPVVGVDVIPMRWDTEYQYWEPLTASVRTGVNGTYAVEALEAGDYLVKIVDPDGELRTTFWGGGWHTEHEDTTIIPLADAEVVTDIDIDLEPAGVIEGTVTDAEGNGIAIVGAHAFRMDPATGRWINVESVATGSDGRYRLGGLPPANYRVSFQPFASDHLGEYYDNVTSLDTATPVQVAAGATVAANAELALGGAISGLVRGPEEQPLGDVDVTAYSFDPGSQRWVEAGSDRTDTDGTYTIPRLRAGDYRVGFADVAGAYIEQFWWNVLRVEDAYDVEVRAGETTPDVDAFLEEGGRITGRVTAAGGTALAGATVYAHQLDGSRWNAVASDRTDNDGDYELGGLSPGTYRVSFRAPGGSPYLDEWWRDAAGVGGAEDVVLFAESTVEDVDAELALGGSVSGTVTTDAGTPAVGVEVYAHRSTPSGSWTATGPATTDAEGDYELVGLVPGDYRLEFVDPDAELASEFWNDAVDRANGTTVTVAAGQPVTGISPVLATSARVAGTVSGPGGEPLEYVAAEAYAWNAATETWVYANAAPTDADGRYEIGRLRAGTYRILFIDTEYRYSPEYWLDATELENATSIVLTAGQLADDLDPVLDVGGSISGVVTGPTGEPLGDVVVDASRRLLNGQYEPVRSVGTEDDGSYELTGLASGTYRISFRDDGGRGLAREYWNDAASPGEATDIQVTAGTEVEGRDAQLTEGARISGTVTSIFGSGLGRVQVTAYQMVGTTSVGTFSTNTAADGTYEVVGLPGSTYRLRFRDPEGRGFRTEFWGDAAYLQDADEVTVATAGSRPEIDAELSLDEPPLRNVAAPSVSGQALVGYPLTAGAGTWRSASADFSYQWLVGDQPVAGATGATYTPKIADLGKTVRVEVTATRVGYVAQAALSAPTAPVGQASLASTSAPTVIGSPRVGAPVSSSPGTWAPDGATLTHQWLVGGVAVAGATGTAYTPRPGDAGKLLQVRITATKADHVAATADSAGVRVLAGEVSATTAPRLTGKAAWGARLTVAKGRWSPVGAKVTVQWFAGKKAIAKATGTTLKIAGKVAKAATGKRISVRITVTAAGYSTHTKTLVARGKVVKPKRR